MKNNKWGFIKLFCLIFLGTFACRDEGVNVCAKYVVDGKYRKAIKVCTNFIDKTKDEKIRAKYIGYRSAAYYGMGKFDLSIVDCSKKLEIIPNSMGAHVMCGRAYAGKAEYDKAIEYFNEALEINNDKFKADTMDILFIRGHAYRGKKQYDLAIADYTKAIDINPYGSRIYNSRGEAYILNDQSDNAIKDFNKAISLDPLYAMPYYNMARYFSIRHEDGEACTFLMKATDLGFDQWNDINQEKDFDTIRQAPCYAEILSLKHKMKLFYKKISEIKLFSADGD